ncbi:MAG: methylenetetrahydrofolate reductase [Lachnospiraceae bacterium]|nr:methylenetetrahydrofolate reductase [NAD(P)H] [Lachnospiraceae bacterium]
MKLAQQFVPGKTNYSFEIFPPKRTDAVESVYHAIDELAPLKPDFISVTYGAGGNPANTFTVDIASDIKKRYGIESAAHLTCVNNSFEDIDRILQRLKEKGVENILALRGDENPDVPPKNDFKYAKDLIAYIRGHGDFGISAACYPEGHIGCESIDKDIEHLKEKVDAGAEHLISQLFFDNETYYRFEEKVRRAGISVPMEAGIMPVTSIASITRMVTLCGASLPRKFTQMMQRYQNYPEAVRDAGIAYAVDQIVDLAAHGVDGIHLYTMNNPTVAKRITEAVESLVRPHRLGERG